MDFKVHKNLPSSSVFYTQAVTFVNRAIALDREFFARSILEPLCLQKGIGFGQFVEAWFSKMELIVSQEARRINLIALYSLVPYFSGDLLQRSFGEIGRMTFSILESHLHLKLVSGEATRLCSPSKVSHYHMVSTKVKINMMEKVSQRTEALKREDPLLELDIVDHFALKMVEVKNALNVQPDLAVLASCLPDEHL